MESVDQSLEVSYVKQVGTEKPFWKEKSDKVLSPYDFLRIWQKVKEAKAIKLQI
jgi:hypothetical protein